MWLKRGLCQDSPVTTLAPAAPNHGPAAAADGAGHGLDGEGGCIASWRAQTRCNVFPGSNPVEPFLRPWAGQALEAPLDDVDLHPSTLAALMRCGPEPDMEYMRRCAHFYIFTDGTVGKKGAGKEDAAMAEPAWGAAVVAETARGYHFLGYFGGRVADTAGELLEKEPTEQCAELLGIIWAGLFAMQLPEGRRVDIVADSKAGLSLADGAFTPTTNEALATYAAQIVQVLRRRISLDLLHVSSHAGHPWNELADRVADLCAVKGTRGARRALCSICGRAGPCTGHGCPLPPPRSARRTRTSSTATS